MKKLFLLALLLFSGCSPEVPDSRGDLLFVMDCVWSPYSVGDWRVEWVCRKHTNNEFVSGFLTLALKEDPPGLDFCGRDLIINTGDRLYDALAETLTRDKFKCIELTDYVPNNEFDWTWDNISYQLTMIWRPPENPQKHITLTIDSGEAHEFIEGRVYYLEVDI